MRHERILGCERPPGASSDDACPISGVDAGRGPEGHEVVVFDQVARRLPGGSDEARRKAIARLAEVGLPHRRIEEWKYTDLRNVLREAFAPAEAIGSAISGGDVVRALGPLAVIDAERLVFVDGYFSPMLSVRG